jgi:hypothetical protein
MKRLLGCILIIPVFFILASVFSTRLEAQRRYDRPNQYQDRVCFYTDENYRGDSFCADAGQSMHNVGGRFNDQISSIRIFGRTEVTVFEHDNFGGARMAVTQDIPNLRGWNDMITSFRVSGGPRSDGFGFDRQGGEPRNGACFYTDENFNGRGFCLESGQSERNVGGRFNDRISSIRLFGRARVTVFADENYSGRGKDIDRDIRNLRSLNDEITSVRVR